MDKLIITVTVDSTVSYPANHYMPPIEDVETVGQHYIDAVNAGASICHHHGVHYLDDKIQEDGRKLSKVNLDGWRDLTDRIKTVGTDPIIQFGIASARLPEKIEMMKLGPDMMSYSFVAHDEHFHPDPNYPPIEVYALHPRDELAAFTAACKEHGVKPEVECFGTGAYFNLEYIRKQGLLDDPIWATIFIGWGGGVWTPPTHDAILYMVNHLPPNVNWNCSVMDPATQWKLMPLVIAAGGHVRVGWEDNPYLPNGELAKTNAEIVEVIVRMAECIGREVATPQEAREITGLTAKAAVA